MVNRVSVYVMISRPPPWNRKSAVQLTFREAPRFKPMRGLHLFRSECDGKSAPSTSADTSGCTQQLAGDRRLETSCLHPSEHINVKPFQTVMPQVGSPRPQKRTRLITLFTQYVFQTHYHCRRRHERLCYCCSFRPRVVQHWPNSMLCVTICHIQRITHRVSI